MRSIGAALPKTLTSLGITRRTREAQALWLWPQVVGEHLARETKALKLTGGTLSAGPGRAGGRPPRGGAIRPHLSRLRSTFSPGRGLALRHPKGVSHRVRGAQVGAHARRPNGVAAGPTLSRPAALRAHRRAAQAGRTSKAGVGLSGEFPSVGTA